MTRYSTLIVFLLFALSVSGQQKKPFRGMHINRSVSLRKGSYVIDAYRSLDSSVVYIEGNDVVVDFKGLTLKGGSGKTNPDEFFGVAVIVRNAHNVTIRNLNVHGYKVAILAQNIDGLHIENCDLSYNYRQHLNSTQEKEDLSDWMSYHHNEKDEWLRYGAAIYMRGCNNAVIHDTKVTGGQNAVMMMECNGALIYNNDFSFNSGIGLGMYRCNRNKVAYNRINFNVRGYSDGIYNRGQDSAGILVYEQSNDNIFFKNSVTHGGDGFFLWAGQTTMDSGKGGCNDNILWGNDFSYAPTNGIEVTFSRNQIIHNRVYECDHGIWGGYSYGSRISENQFRNNRVAIAIEHGQYDTINHNLFINNKTGVKLWAKPDQNPDWGYARYRDTRSRLYQFVANSFNQSDLVYDLAQTDSIAEFNNVYNDCARIFKKDSTVTINHELNDELLVSLSEEFIADTPNIKSPIRPFQGNGRLQGRKAIRMTSWGPYDYQYPMIWLLNPADSTNQMRFDVTGPAGHWKIIRSKGLTSVSKKSGAMNSGLEAIKGGGKIIDIEIRALYTGKAFTDQFGNTLRSNKPVYFTFKKFFQPIDFHVKWYAADSVDDPIRLKSTAAVIERDPIKSEDTDQLDYAWWGGIKAAEKTYPRFLTVAEGVSNFQGGNYEFSITWDDAVRIYVDGKLVLDEWNPGKYQFDESPNRKVRLRLATGEHKLRVEHVGQGGFAALSLKINKL